MERLLQKAEIVTAWGISEPTLDRLIRAGRLPVVRLTKRTVRIPESALRRLIAESTKDDAAPTSVLRTRT